MIHPNGLSYRLNESSSKLVSSACAEKELKEVIALPPIFRDRHNPRARRPSLGSRSLTPKTVETKIEESNEAKMQAGDVQDADVASNSDKQLKPGQKVMIWHDREQKSFTKWEDGEAYHPLARRD